MEKEGKASVLDQLLERIPSYRCVGCCYHDMDRGCVYSGVFPLKDPCIAIRAKEGKESMVMKWPPD